LHNSITADRQSDDIIMPIADHTTARSTLQSNNKKAVISPGEPCDASVNFDRYQILQRHPTGLLL